MRLNELRVEAKCSFERFDRLVRILLLHVHKTDITPRHCKSWAHFSSFLVHLKAFVKITFMHRKATELNISLCDIGFQSNDFFKSLFASSRLRSATKDTPKL